MPAHAAQSKVPRARAHHLAGKMPRLSLQPASIGSPSFARTFQRSNGRATRQVRCVWRLMLYSRVLRPRLRSSFCCCCSGDASAYREQLTVCARLDRAHALARSATAARVLVIGVLVSGS
jgi:hypothetical protein